MHDDVLVDDLVSKGEGWNVEDVDVASFGTQQQALAVCRQAACRDGLHFAAHSQSSNQQDYPWSSIWSFNIPIFSMKQYHHQQQSGIHFTVHSQSSNQPNYPMSSRVHSPYATLSCTHADHHSLLSAHLVSHPKGKS